MTHGTSLSKCRTMVSLRIYIMKSYKSSLFLNLPTFHSEMFNLSRKKRLCDLRNAFKLILERDIKIHYIHFPINPSLKAILILIIQNLKIFDTTCFYLKVGSKFMVDVLPVCQLLFIIIIVACVRTYVTRVYLF